MLNNEHKDITVLPIVPRRGRRCRAAIFRVLTRRPRIDREAHRRVIGSRIFSVLMQAASAAVVVLEEEILVAVTDSEGEDSEEADSAAAVLVADDGRIARG
jgi:hypothetical protein